METSRSCIALVLIFCISDGIAAAVSEGAKPSVELPLPLPLVVRNLQHKRTDGVAPNPVASHSRVKRQNGVIIDSIFQIPIQTLSAVNNLFKNSVLAIQNFRRPETPQASTAASSSLQQYVSNGLGAFSGSYNGVSNNRPSPSYSGAFYNGNYNNGGSGSYYRPSRKYQSAAAMRGDLPVKNDGSSYRI